MFENFSKKIGFTQTEIIVILYLASLFVLGYVYVEFIKDDSQPENKYFDYSKEDSLFNFYSGRNQGDSLSDKNFEIKKQVLELSDSISYVKKEITGLSEKSINLNNAGIIELIRLPGIGEKTAEKIIELRTQKGKFTNLEELMDVKGIGEVKFNKIKKFLYIE